MIKVDLQNTFVVHVCFGILVFVIDLHISSKFTVYLLVSFNEGNNMSIVDF